MDIRPLSAADAAALAPLIAESEAEGFCFVRRILDEVSRPRVMMCGVYEMAQLIAVGGVTPDPYVADDSVGRIRHVYVRRDHRRRGIGRRLIAMLEQHARARFIRVRLRTDRPHAAAFYEALHYERITDASATHARDFAPGPALEPRQEHHAR